jgi:hypothetical protein
MDWDVAAVTYEKSKVHAGGDCHALSFSTIKIIMEGNFIIGK